MSSCKAPTPPPIIYHSRCFRHSHLYLSVSFSSEPAYAKWRWGVSRAKKDDNKNSLGHFQSCFFMRDSKCVHHHYFLLSPEPVFLKVYGAQESIPRNEFLQPMYDTILYDNPIPTRFPAPIYCLKIPALLFFCVAEPNKTTVNTVWTTFNNFPLRRTPNVLKLFGSAL